MSHPFSRSAVWGSARPSLAPLFLASVTLLAIGSASCAPSVRAPVHLDCSTVKMSALPPATPLMAFEGFSITPPQADQWCVEHLDKKIGAIFVTNPLIGQTLTAMPPAEDQSHTLAAAVMAVYLDQPVFDDTALRDFVARWLGSGQLSQVREGHQVLESSSTTPHRFTLVESNVVIDESPNCIRYDATFEERDNPHFPGQVLILVEKANLLCRVPGSKTGELVMIGASERYPQARPPAWKYMDTARGELDAFTRSLRFPAAP